MLESSAGIGSYKVVLHSIANDSIVPPEETFARERELREQIVEKTLAIVDSMRIYGEERDSLLMSFAATWFGFGEASSDNMSQYIMWSRPTFYSGGLSAWKAIQSSDNRYETLGEMGRYLGHSNFALDDMLLDVGLNQSLAALLAGSGWRADQIVSGSEAVVSAFCSTMREREPELQRLYHYDQYEGGGLLSQESCLPPLVERMGLREEFAPDGYCHACRGAWRAWHGRESYSRSGQVPRVARLARRSARSPRFLSRDGG